MSNSEFAQGIRLRDALEFVGVMSIVVSMIFLIIEIRNNSLAIEQQAALNRAEAISAAYYESELPSILAKIRNVDGDFGFPDRLVERYELSPKEAILWERHLWHVWESIQASYITEGEAPTLEKQIRLLLVSPSNHIYIENALKYQFNDDFRAYVLRLLETNPEFLDELQEK